MSLAHDYRSQLHAEHRARRAFMDHVAPSMPKATRLLRVIPLVRTSYVGDQNEHVKQWMIACSLRASRTKATVIALEVCRKHEISPAQLRSPSRLAVFVRARQELFYRLATETKFSLSQIGSAVGGKDHTSVLHGIRMHAARNGLPDPRPCLGKKQALRYVR